MSSLSAKARAFSVDELLGKKEKQAAPTDVKNDSKLSPDGEEICPFMGDDQNCRHKNTVEVAGQFLCHIFFRLHECNFTL